MPSSPIVYPRFHYSKTFMLVELLAGFMQHAGKICVQVSQDTLCKAFQRRFGQSLSRRHLNRLLDDARKWGAIKQRRTHTRSPDGKFVPGVTLTWLADRGWQLLRRLADTARSLSGVYRVPSTTQNRDPKPSVTGSAASRRRARPWYSPPPEVVRPRPRRIDTPAAAEAVLQTLIEHVSPAL